MFNLRLGTIFNDNLTADGPANIFVGLSGADTISTNGVFDFAYGGYNNDTIFMGGNGGYARVFGGADNDNFVVEASPTTFSWTRIGDFREEGDDLRGRIAVGINAGFGKPAHPVFARPARIGHDEAGIGRKAQPIALLQGAPLADRSGDRAVGGLPDLRLNPNIWRRR